MKQTLQQKLHQKKIKKPPYIIYNVLGFIWKLLYKKRLNIHFEYKINLKKYRGPYIVVSNHASRADYIYTGVAFLPHTLNYVAGYNEFFRSHLKGIFNLLQVIPKKNFTADFYTIKEIKRIIKQKGRVAIFPEGMSSISGANQPVAIGSAKFLKHCQVPVLYTVISGGYLTNPKYNLDERPGRVDVVIDQLFTVDELNSLSEKEIEDRLNDKLYHDDYAWNKEKHYKFNTNKQPALNLHHLLYWCPKCHQDLKMISDNTTIKCLNCGNGASLDDYYDFHPFDDTCIIPTTPKVWLDEERKEMKQKVKDPDFQLVAKVKLGMLPKYQYLKQQKTSEIVGAGKLTLNRTGLTYEGTLNDQPFKFHIESQLLPTYGMCTDVTRFYTFFNDDFYEFYPDEEVVEMFFLATEEIHRLNKGKWENYYEK